MPHSYEDSDSQSSDEEENVSKAKPPTIVGSKSTSIRKYPYNAAVISFSGILLGGGMIYNRRWVLTAGVNCVILLPSELTVRVGSDSAYRGGQCYGVQKVIPYPYYTGGDWDWNVGLLKLKRNIRFSKKVKAIRLSKSTPNNSTSAVVTGWGLTNVLPKRVEYDANSAASRDGNRLQYLVTDVIDTESCMKYWNVSITTRTYCGHVPNSGPCISDIGDPLVHKGVAVGMYSGGYFCGEDRYPDFYVDLAQFTEWIHETIKDNTDSSESVSSKVFYYTG